jgi:hypothetical protein
VSEDPIEIQAQQAADAILRDIKTTGEEDPRRTIRLVNEIRDARIRARVLDILRERREAEEAEG